MEAALIGFAVLLILIIVIRMPIALAMGLVGFFGFAAMQGLTLGNMADFNWRPVLTMASRRVIDTAQDYHLSVIPLFVLMGNLITHSGMSQQLYNAAYAFLGHRRGGLAMSTIVACGGFSAICGSSLATSATMAKVAMPPMRKFGYSDGLATASIAAGGTLGILIPPSVILVMYGLLTETSIRELFAAGFIPGLLGVLLYLAAVQYIVWRNPKSGPRGEKLNWKERWESMREVRGIIALFALVMGGIYGGIFTPTEAAGIGAGGAFLIALFRKSLTLQTLFEVITDSTRTTAMLFGVLIGALIFSNFINRAGLPDDLLQFVIDMNLQPMLVIFAILVIYMLLGMVFESLSMLLLTVPVFFPLVANLGFDLVWFGIVVVVVTEISLITPPVGMNVFVLSAILKDINTGVIFRGVTPFWIADLIRLAIIVLVAQISLFLPQLLYG
ncbi:C4-dicarboxylate ABC transporter permease [Endozoicomonas montiporae]|uniref:TRAP transporter large permease protein n=2 Tax=Endozoicomonas montiporae TaxID=1027273 RepID=A0A081MZK7_9GAMM|nr:TRAP transporter large permease [Endozoicomonas montiporae]AMO54688.1 TRAP dicarboxylate transporter subunit DctM [Endozoicomonas montiporae CL-33]KEQ11630.1 C4-dicarboxylate ABC transporter permease [Endozoicomonas montiporae]